MAKYTTVLAKFRKDAPLKLRKGKLVIVWLSKFSVYLLYRVCKILKEAAPCMYITLLVWRRRV